MGVALQRLSEEDPTFKVYTHEDTGQTIIAGMGELHLEIIRDRMSANSKWMRMRANADRVSRNNHHQRARCWQVNQQSGGRGQYGHVSGFTAGERSKGSSSKQDGRRRFRANTSRRQKVSKKQCSRSARRLPSRRCEADIVFEASTKSIRANSRQMAAIFAMKTASGRENRFCSSDHEVETSPRKNTGDLSAT